MAKNLESAGSIFIAQKEKHEVKGISMPVISKKRRKTNDSCETSLANDHKTLEKDSYDHHHATRTNVNSNISSLLVDYTSD